MANLKDIKNRIQSVENTKKITKAMKMVAAAKVKRAESTVKSARPFSDELLSLFKTLLDKVDIAVSNGIHPERAIDDYQELLTKREVKSVGLLVITSNKGLAGAYNANLARAVMKEIQENKANGKNTVLYVAGMKGISALKHVTDGARIAKTYVQVVETPTSGGSDMIAQDIATDFVAGEIDEIKIITTRFNNMMSYSISESTLLPVDLEHIEAKELNPLMEFEPSASHVLQSLVPMYLSNSIF
jgi:F-type H+-transporting ATPase subunit gamma